MKFGLHNTTNKKKPSGIEKTNYRPVSNLGFVSKVVKKLCLHNIPNIVMKIDYYPHISQHIGEIAVARLVW